MEGLRRWLSDGEEDGGVHSPEVFPLPSGVGILGGRGGSRRRPAVLGVKANLAIPPSCTSQYDSVYQSCLDMLLMVIQSQWCQWPFIFTNSLILTGKWISHAL